MGKTILQEWRKFMDDTYESDVHQNGFWNPCTKGPNVSVKTCNAQIKWFLDKIGHLTVPEMDISSRLLCLENKMRAQETAQVDTLTKMNTISDTIKDIKVASI